MNHTNGAVSGFIIVLLAVIILPIIFGIAVLIVSLVQKSRLSEQEKKKDSRLLRMSYTDENKSLVSHRLDSDTAKNKKYCPHCKALVEKRSPSCSECGYNFVSGNR